MVITAVIIDDETNNIENLSALLIRLFPKLKITGVATDADLAETLILQVRPHIVFLDIQMPRKNGFDLLRSLTTHDFELIFVTAYDQFAIQAIKFSAIDYLLKPLNEDELKIAVQLAISKSEEKTQNTRLLNLLDVLRKQQSTDSHRIALHSSEEIRFVKAVEIVRCESSNNYTTFYLAGGDRVITSKPIYEFEELLEGYGFIRCHQTHLVNKRYIKSLVKQEGGFLLLEDGSSIPVSRMKRDKVKNALKAF